MCDRQATGGGFDGVKSELVNLRIEKGAEEPNRAHLPKISSESCSILSSSSREVLLHTNYPSAFTSIVTAFLLDSHLRSTGLNVLGYQSHVLQLCHPACGHEGSSYLSPVLAYDFLLRCKFTPRQTNHNG